MWITSPLTRLPGKGSVFLTHPVQKSASRLKKKSTFRGFELAGKTLGVIGLGQVGVRVANGGTKRQMKTIV